MARLLVVDDEVRYRDLYAQTLARAGIEAAQAGSAEEALELLGEGPVDMVVSDVRMPGQDGLFLLRRARERWPALPFLLVTAFADVRGAVDALKLGAVDYLAKPVDLDELLAAVHDALGIASPAADELLPAGALAGIVAESPAMRAVLRDAFVVSPSDAPVLLTGESGTGKEVVAKFIHQHSRRKAGPLVAVNCAAVPQGLLASELFGHEKGAFTGATERRTGRFREAHKGTVLLDEIGDMPLDLQPVLLRALDTGRVSPVGSDKDAPVDCRVIAATNKDLEAEVAAGRFRLDLYHRLNVIHLALPALRERPEDILPLARHFLGKHDDPPKRLSRAAQSALSLHTWPGNVRELANAMERARLLARSDVVLPECLPPALRKLPVAPDTPVPDAAAGRMLEDAERVALEEALRRTNGNRTRAAELLGVSRRGLIYKLKRFGL
jgi:two-component system, NtrC family, response regulator HydG